jgi:hypothetical protein
MVEPEVREDGRPHVAIIHLDSIFRAAHLTPAYRTSDFVRRSLTMHDTLDEFTTFYVNKLVDHHALDIVSYYVVGQNYVVSSIICYHMLTLPQTASPMVTASVWILYCHCIMILLYI